MTHDPHITICICTFKRPALLDRLLAGLQGQETRGLFRYSIVVVDNDHEASTRSVTEKWVRKLPMPLRYEIEPVQNIAMARSLSVAHATGDLVAFIDDDEEPIQDWLVTLYTTLVRLSADGVLGPVKPRFSSTAPAWASNGDVFDRPGFSTGDLVDWRVTGTGNVLLWRYVFDGFDQPFSPRFPCGGEDVDFFRQATQAGRRFVWCNEAVVYETIPPERTRLMFQIRRALLRGKVSLSGPAGTWKGIARSALACIVYAVMLPVLIPLGSHVFVKYLIKGCDHLGKLVAVCGLDLVGNTYIQK